ncbi:MAG: hypothetical protein AAF471_08000 [Myxococcota bacterium]
MTRKTRQSRRFFWTAITALLAAQLGAIGAAAAQTSDHDDHGTDDWVIQENPFGPRRQADVKEDGDHDEEDDNLYSQARRSSTNPGWFSKQGMTRLFGTVQQTPQRQFVSQTHTLGPQQQFGGRLDPEKEKLYQQLAEQRKELAKWKMEFDQKQRQKERDLQEKENKLAQQQDMEQKLIEQQKEFDRKQEEELTKQRQLQQELADEKEKIARKKIEAEQELREKEKLLMQQQQEQNKNRMEQRKRLLSSQRQHGGTQNNSWEN